MLTADLVRARIRKDRIEPIGMGDKMRGRAMEIGEAYGGFLATMVGETRGDIKEALDAVQVSPSEQRVADGLRKLLLDRCHFENPDDVDPPTLRATLFGRAAKVRAALEPGTRFDRDIVLQAVAQEVGLSVEAIEGGLYADLKEAQRLLSFENLKPESLLKTYQLAQEQALLLKARRVVIEAKFREPGAARSFFHRLKFRRLLYRLEAIKGGGYRIEVDGPMSLFQLNTRYGLQLALMLPALRDNAEFSLSAELTWGKYKKDVTLELEGRPKGPVQKSKRRLPDEVEKLLAQFKKLKTDWSVRSASKVLNLPGVGLCVPDLVFSHPDRKPAYLEVMGFWSRDAVWKRVDLVEGGLGERVLFAVSSRLRVSEAILGDREEAALYVYKGSMSAKTILERIDGLGDSAK